MLSTSLLQKYCFKRFDFLREELEFFSTHMQVFVTNRASYLSSMIIYFIEILMCLKKY